MYRADDRDANKGADGAKATADVMAIAEVTTDVRNFMIDRCVR